MHTLEKEKEEHKKGSMATNDRIFKYFILSSELVIEKVVQKA